MKKALLIKIKLCDVDPSIWRSVWIEESVTFQELHLTIQAAMGWSNYHCYHFDIENNLIEERDCENTLVSKYLRNEGQTFKYTYDYGDDWEHKIVVEKVEAIKNESYYPLCIDGARCCPPEDVGGSYTYLCFSEIVKDKNHPGYRDRMEWLERTHIHGRDFDPEKFDLGYLNQRLQCLHNWLFFPDFPVKEN